MTRWKTRILALSLGLVGATLATEVALRLLWTPFQLRSSVPLEPHAVYGYRPIPGAYGREVTSEYDVEVHNSRWGWRNLETLDPPADRGRLLAFGDSFIYGVGLGDDQTLAARLRAELPEWHVDALGANGYGQFHQLAALDHLGPRLRPDVVLLVFFWNDLEDNLGEHVPGYELGDDDRVRRSDGIDVAATPIDAADPHAATPRRAPASYLGSFVADGLKAIRYRWFGIKSRRIRDETQRDAAWTRTRVALELCARRAGELGATPVVTCIPDHNRVDPGARIPGIEKINFEVEEILARTCADLDIAFLPTLDAMHRAHRQATEQAGEPLYYYADRHLTPAGMRAFAAAVAAGLPTALQR